MKLRQALKIGNNTTISNLVTREINGTIYVVGIKNTPYTFRQFCKAYRVIRKAFNRCDK